jgi:hypothetical protein
LVCVNDKGQFGASAIGEFQQYFKVGITNVTFTLLKYAVRNATMSTVQVFDWRDASD